MAYISPYRHQYSSKPTPEELAACNIAANIQQKELEKAKYNKNTSINDEVCEYVEKRFTRFEQRVEQKINKIIDYLPTSQYKSFTIEFEPKPELFSNPYKDYYHDPNPYKDRYHDPNCDKYAFIASLSKSQRVLYDHSHSPPSYEKRRVHFNMNQQCERPFIAPAAAGAIARSGAATDVDFEDIRNTIKLVNNS